MARVSKSIFGDSSCAMDVYRLIRQELPPPPGRVLEVGCGNGELARALAGDGFEVVAVDPKAPDGEIFRRATIEELGDEGLFDGAVASLSLHHVHDLSVAIARVHASLRPGAPFVVREFAWDLVDEPTARWDYERRGRAGGLAEWRAEHEDLHGFAELRAALDSRFGERSFAWGPYLAEHEAGDGQVEEERRLIAEGEIRAIGFVYVGLA
jgi:SAM-dependent methyltransferase